MGSKLNSFIDGDFRDLAGLAAQLNYRVTADFAAFAAFEYKNDYGHAYWGTPLVPVSFAGSHAVSGVVSGTAVNTFDGSIIGPLTIDSRTLTTNYNVADNATGAHDLWLRAVSRGRRSRTSPSRINIIPIRPNEAGSTAKPMPSTMRPRPSIATDFS